MERVPQIRLFGTSQSWKHNSSTYKKKYTEAGSGISEAFSYESKPVFERSIQRSNSVNQLNYSKPSQSNYYQNAIRICQQNQVLNKIKGHNFGFFVAPYLTTNHNQHHLKKSCTLCQAQTITKNLQLRQIKPIYRQNHNFQPLKMDVLQQSEEFSSNFHQKNIQSQQVNSKTKQIQRSGIKNQMTETDEKCSTERTNPIFLQNNPVEIHKTSLKVISFQEITNIPASNIISQEHPVVDGLKNLNTQRSQNSSNGILLSKCQTFGQTKNQKPVKNYSIKNLFMPQISQLISQLSLEDYETSNTSEMLKDLEEMTQKHLLKRKSCIEEIDFILQKCEKQMNRDLSPGENEAFPSLNVWFNQNRASDDIPSPNSKRRNRIF